MNKQLGYLISVVADVAQGKIVVRSLSDINKAYKDTAANADKSTRKMGDFEKALRRVAVVVPVWMAFRSVLQGVFATITEGFKFMEELDSAMVRNRAVIQGFSGDMNLATEAIRNTTRSLSLLTGRSVTEVAEVFYQVAERGIDMKTALEGMVPILKTSIAIMGNSAQVGKVLAMTYDLLGHTMDDSLSSTQKFERMGGLLSVLWQKNAFELDEFISSLKMSAGTFSQFGVSAENAMSLLATLHQGGFVGSMAGTIVRNLFKDMTENVDILNDTLGITIEKGKSMDAWKTLVTVLTRINELGDKTPEKLDAVFKVFNDRAVKGVLALMAMPRKFAENIAMSAASAEELSGKLEELYQIQINKIETQRKIFYNMRNEMVNAFLMGATGTNSIVDALKAVNTQMREGIAKAFVLGVELKKIGESLSALANVPTPNRGIGGFFQGFMSRLGGAALGAKTMGIPGAITGFLAGGAADKWGYMMTDEGAKYSKAYTELEKEFGERLRMNFEGDVSKGMMSDFAYRYATGNLEINDDIVQTIANQTNMGQREVLEALNRVFQKARSAGGVMNMEQEVAAAKEYVAKLTEFGEMPKDGGTDEKETALERRIKELLQQMNGGEGGRTGMVSAIQNELDLLQERQMLMYDELRGLTQIEMAYNKIATSVQHYVDVYNKKITAEGVNVEQLDAQKVLLDVLSGDTERLVALVDKKVLSETQAKLLLKQEGDLLEANIELVKKYSSEFRGSFQGGLAELLRGDIDMGGFMKKMKEQIRTSWSEAFSTNVTNTIMKGTGLDLLFGNIMGTLENPISRAHIEGITKGANILKSTYADINGTNGAQGATRGTTVPSWIPFAETLGKSMGSFWNNMSYLQGGQQLITGYMANRSSGGNSTTGMLGAIGGLLGSTGNPILSLVGAGLSIFSNIMASKQRSSQATTTEGQVSSKLDVTNNELRLVNRNIVGLKNALTYVLRESAYLSEKNTIEDDFSLHSRRGLVE
jgi:TP901 family phage tail tape measure protein